MLTQSKQIITIEMQDPQKTSTKIYTIHNLGIEIEVQEWRIFQEYSLDFIPQINATYAEFRNRAIPFTIRGRYAYIQYHLAKTVSIHSLSVIRVPVILSHS